MFFKTTNRLGLGALFACAITVAALAGCEMTTHQQRRDQAQRHWCHVRAQVKHQLATQQFEAGELEAAIATAREVIGLDPEATDSYLLLARALLEKGDMGEARRTLQVAEGMRLDSPDLAYTRGVVAERAGDLSEALEFYTQARRQDPSQIDYLVAQAECLVAVGRPEEARGLVRESMDQFDRTGTLDVLEAEISLALDDWEAAADAFRRAMPLVSEDPLVTGTYGLLLVRMGRFAEAVAVLRPVLDAADDEPSGAVMRGLAQSYVELGRHESAIDLLDQWTRENPEDSAAWFLQTRAAIAQGDEALARRCAAAVRRLAPGDAQTYLLSGYVCWRQGEIDSALDLFERALALTADDVLLHCLMGQVLTDANEIHRARQHWRRALQIDPDSRWARNGLKRLDGRQAG
jgi:tetratricopeptide (TPR) repeat protein